MARDSDVLDAIRAEFEDAVDWTPDGHATQPTVAVRMDRAGDDFTGAGRSVRVTIFQVAWADWPFGSSPAAPAVGDMIDDSATVWRAVNIDTRDDVEAWDVTVEKA